jgi:hypothetical protein
LTEPSSSDPSSGAGTAPPGLGEQFGKTRSAVLGLIAAHIDLARAEFSEIGGRIMRAAALAGIAFVLLVAMGMLIFVGLPLFLGETLFGSMGWGLLDGTELLLAIAVLLVLAIVEFSWGRLAGSFIVALGVGLIVTGLLAANWQSITSGYSGLGSLPWASIISGGVLLGLVGVLLGASFGRGAAGAGMVAGIIFGFLLGWLASAGPGIRVSAAIGVAVVLLLWPIVAAVLLFRHGVDREKLKARFVPSQTIETTKETIEWVREQMPLGRKS